MSRKPQSILPQGRHTLWSSTPGSLRTTGSYTCFFWRRSHIRRKRRAWLVSPGKSDRRRGYSYPNRVALIPLSRLGVIAKQAAQFCRISRGDNLLPGTSPTRSLARQVSPPAGTSRCPRVVSVTVWAAGAESWPWLFTPTFPDFR